MHVNFLTATATEIAHAVARRDTTAEKVARAFIARVEELEPYVHAFSWYDPQDILRQADEIDRGERGGPLAGVPLGVKDVFDTRDIPTEFFSPIYAGNKPSRDAAVVARLRAMGAIVMGKTATTEFAFMHTGPTRNPHDLDRTPGSSSAGSAAGVAAGFFPLALGTQTAGSLLKPASFCGAFAYKPSFGLVSMEGIKPLAPAFDTVGWFGRSVEDLARVGRALIANLPSLPSLPRLRLALVRSRRSETSDGALRSYLEAVCGQLRAAGHIVDDLEEPVGFGSSYEDHRIVNDAQGARSLAFERELDIELLSEEAKAMIAHADEVSWEAERAAQQRLSGLRNAIEPVVAAYDGVLDLSTASVAPVGLISTGPSDLIKVWSGFGFPQVNLPVQAGPGELPFGLQLFAARYDDARLLASASSVARCIGAARVPPLPISPPLRT
ncbi:amidase [Aurantimonas aggregata]|uniref:Amidase n=1 Tax=Aurantimonas aggregata TaxID=2047720 RepID=A0A6L9MML0_9HYPH|nr:amidase [Aurantimonas aggregata]NDV89109.1 amidase [Aurantimonas aggregata]